MSISHVAIALSAAVLIATSSRMPAHSEPIAKCASDSAYHALDFWIGDWTVVDSTGARLGTNRIEKILDGCAITETWREPESEGRSLFYYVPSQRMWKQVWVTPSALAAGGIKEKHLVTSGPGRARFQGELVGPAGLLLLDRTTLTAIPGGRVRQVIEISRDGGTTWRTTFDGIYTRTATPPPIDPRDTTRTLGLPIHQHLMYCIEDDQSRRRSARTTMATVSPLLAIEPGKRRRRRAALSLCTARRRVRRRWRDARRGRR